MTESELAIYLDSEAARYEIGQVIRGGMVIRKGPREIADDVIGYLKGKATPPLQASEADTCLECVDWNAHSGRFVRCILSKGHAGDHDKTDNGDYSRYRSGTDGVDD